MDYFKKLEIGNKNKSYIKNVTTIPPPSTHQTTSASSFGRLHDGSTFSVMKVNLDIGTSLKTTTPSVPTIPKTSTTTNLTQFLNYQKPATLQSTNVVQQVIPFQAPTPASITSTEPPPLLFFPKTKKVIVRQPTNFPSEPPPLVPIGSKR